MDEDLAQKAISAALKGDWSRAVKINKKILQINPRNLDAFNRLARSYAELGDLVKAKQTAQKALIIDPFNSIALKSLDKWRLLKKSESYVSKNYSAEDFIEEPGRTKIVNLMHLGAEKILAKLDSGDEVVLNPHGHRISVVTNDGIYIGRLPDDVGCKLKKLISLGNEYKVLIKSIEPQEVKIFIREKKTVPKLASIPSFPMEKIDYVSFTPPELVHKKEDLQIPHYEDEE